MTDTYTEDEIREMYKTYNPDCRNIALTADQAIAALKKPQFAEGQVVIITNGNALTWWHEASKADPTTRRNPTLAELPPAVRALRGCVEISIGRTIGTLTADLHKALAAFDEAIHD